MAGKLLLCLLVLSVVPHDAVQFGLIRDWPAKAVLFRQEENGTQFEHFSERLRSQTEAPGFWEPSLSTVLLEGFVRDAVTHKPLWPLNWRDVVTVIFAAISAFVAASAGLGGGGVLVPLFLLILGFKTHVAVALSNMTIMAGALVNLGFNLTKKHPHLDRPLIDWDLILIMEPTTILGALAGSYLNKVTPSYMTTCGLALLLAYVSQKLVTRAAATWQKESRQFQAASASAHSAHAPLLPDGAGADPNDDSEAQRGEEARGAEEDAQAAAGGSAAAPERSTGAHKASEPQIPLGKVAALAGLFLAVFASDYAKQLLTCGTLPYWLVVTSVIPLALLVTSVARGILMRQYHSRKASGYLWQEGDVQWTAKTTTLFPLICSSAGLVAGAFGIGGGIVKGPLLLELGVLPDVAAATCATMILFTAAVASMVYLSFGGIPMDYAALFFGLGLLATLAGQLAGTWIMRVLNRKSTIIIAMAVLMVMSLLMSCYEAGVQTRAAILNHVLWQFHHICSPS